MAEEIIIFEQDGNIVGITKEGKYFESYKTTENVAILRGAGLYIKRLEQENKELGRKAFLAEQNVRTTATTFCEKDNKINKLEQENKELKERFEKRGEIMLTAATQRDKYRSVLEEIKDALGYGYIVDKINEVLGCEQ